MVYIEVGKEKEIKNMTDNFECKCGCYPNKCTCCCSKEEPCSHKKRISAWD